MLAVVVVSSGGCGLPPFHAADGGRDAGDRDGDANPAIDQVEGDTPDAMPGQDRLPSECPAPPAGIVFVSVDGDDQLGNGSETCPYRTIGRGLDGLPAAQGERVIQVGPGTYDTERWPITLSEQVTLRGPGEGEAILLGGGPCEIGEATCAVETKSTDVKIEGLTITNPDGRGLNVGASATVELTDVGIRDCSRPGLVVAGTAQVTSTNCHFTGNANGVSLFTRASWSSSGDEISGSSAEGIVVGGSPSESFVQAVILDALVTDNGESGIHVACVEEAGSPSCLTLRSSRLLRNQGSAVRVESGLVDLGRLDDLGGNTLQTSLAANQNVDAAVCNHSQTLLEAEGNLWSQCTPESTVMATGCRGAKDIVQEAEATVVTTTCDVASE